MKWAHFSMLAGVALLTGCATAPVFSPPVLSVGIPEEWTGGDLAVGQVDVEWWNDFADVGLSAAVEMALSRNFDLQAAAARLEQAAADARAANAALHPTVQATYKRCSAQTEFCWLPNSRERGRGPEHGFDKSRRLFGRLLGSRPVAPTTQRVGGNLGGIGGVGGGPTCRPALPGWPNDKVVARNR